MEKEEYPYLSKVSSPADVKAMDADQLSGLVADIRKALLLKLSRHGGHVGPNLGMVEATIALHRVFNSPADKLVWDVSHQSYTHKMLTGRALAFMSPEHYDDVTGYTCPWENEHDLFEIGHTSTSVALATGLAKARDLAGGHNNVIAIIGDGSLSGGEAYEGLNMAAELGTNIIIVVNDNEMSIAENHGGYINNLNLLRATQGKVECNMFKAMGFDYLYVEQGNDIAALTAAFQQVKDTPKPTVVHIHTLKGKGYEPAEQRKEEFHWHMPWNLATGRSDDDGDSENYSDITASFLLGAMKRDPKLVAISAAVPTMMGFTPERRAEAGKQYVDVGIAEAEAVAMSSGLAKAGAHPVFCTASSFFQRTYDQLSQDVCINRSPATFIVAAGTVLGMNDVTHLGFFDIPLISNIPNMVYLAPTTVEEYLAMLQWSINQNQDPVAIKLPGGPVRHSQGKVQTDYSRLNQYEATRRGSRVALLGLGTFHHLATEVADALKQQLGVEATVVNPRYITGLDTAMLDSLKAGHQVVVTIEDGQLDGGFGEKIARYYGPTAVRVLNYGLKKEFVDRYDYAAMLSDSRLTAPQITADVVSLLNE